MAGKLNLIFGPMYSGKTSLLLSRCKRYRIAGKKCIVVKYSGDSRYGDKNVVTHDNIFENAISINKLEDIDQKIKDFDVILIDEIQFYEDAYIYCNKWANENKIVEVSGLNGDFKREPFEQISKIIPLCDSIVHLTAVDPKSGDDAPFTARLIDSSQQKLIGGLDSYQAMNRSNYLLHNHNRSISDININII